VRWAGNIRVLTLILGRERITGIGRYFVFAIATGVDSRIRNSRSGSVYWSKILREFVANFIGILVISHVGLLLWFSTGELDGLTNNLTLVVAPQVRALPWLGCASGGDFGRITTASNWRDCHDQKQQMQGVIPGSAVSILR
jgi:hypothetical protein